MFWNDDNCQIMVTEVTVNDIRSSLKWNISNVNVFDEGPKLVVGPCIVCK